MSGMLQQVLLLCCIWVRLKSGSSGSVSALGVSKSFGLLLYKVAIWIPRIPVSSPQTWRGETDCSAMQPRPFMQIQLITAISIFSGVHGRVTELASATSSKYNIALAVLLGRDMDSVIVDSENVAKDCIKFLKDTHVPPMTFYPLPTIRVRTCARGIPVSPH